LVGRQEGQHTVALHNGFTYETFESNPWRAFTVDQQDGNQVYVFMYTDFCLNCHFPAESGFASSVSVFFLDLFGERTF